MEQLEPKYWSIEKLFNYTFKVPVYQRPFSWENEQVKMLFDDIWDAYSQYKSLSDEKKQKENLYIGNIIIHKRDFEVYDIIDGQQRITTLSIFLLCLYSVINGLNCDSNHGILRTIRDVLWKLDINKNPVQDKRVLELGSIEKDTLIKFFNEGYTSPKNLEQFVNNYTTNNAFEGNMKNTLICVFKFISEKIDGRENKLDELLQFSKFILEKVFIIAIINEDNEFQAFSIFESINSKGKKLEDIDLIKTKIFSELSEDDCKTYADKWGDLIVKTNDKLYDYLMVFIKANIKFYSTNISFKYFNSLNDALCEYYNVDDISIAYKSFIDDLCDNVDSFNTLYNPQIAYKIITDSTFKFYYWIFFKIGYVHPHPLFFKCFCELKNNLLSKEDAREIIIEIIKFCASFMTVSGRDSKDAIPIFKVLCEYYHSTYDDIKVFDKKYIIYKISQQLNEFGIKEEDLIASLKKMDLFDKNKQFGAAVISLFESRYDNGTKIKISWDEAFSKYSTYGSMYTLDHIMNQTPEENDQNLKYYSVKNSLKLKDGADFPDSLVKDGMDYDSFKSIILHKAGNLRLLGGDSNSSRGKTSDFTFNTFKDLDNRNNIISNFIINEMLNLNPNKYTIDIAQYLKINKQKLSGVYNLSENNIDFTGNKPKQIRIGNKKMQVSTNKEILINSIEDLCINNLEKMKNLAKQNWKPRERVVISTSPDLMKSPAKIKDTDIYVETNLSARDTMYYTKRILEMFDVDLKSVEINY